MQSVPGSTRAATGFCDLCRKKLAETSPGDSPVLHCTTCSFDVCAKCVPVHAATAKIALGTYVTVTDDYKSHKGGKDGPLAPGKFGIIVQVDTDDQPFKVGPSFSYIHRPQRNLRLQSVIRTRTLLCPLQSAMLTALSRQPPHRSNLGALSIGTAQALSSLPCQRWDLGIPLIKRAHSPDIAAF